MGFLEIVEIQRETISKWDHSCRSSVLYIKMQTFNGLCTLESKIVSLGVSLNRKVTRNMRLLMKN